MVKSEQSEKILLEFPFLQTEKYTSGKSKFMCIESSLIKSDNEKHC